MQSCVRWVVDAYRQQPAIRVLMVRHGRLWMVAGCEAVLGDCLSSMPLGWPLSTASWIVLQCNNVVVNEQVRLY